MEKRVTSGVEVKRKKGREQISFLIVANLCLWMLYTVTRDKYAYNLFQEAISETENSSYASDYLRAQRPAVNASIGRVIVVSSASSDNAQAVKWIIINTVTYPLLLYFHFHSSCCLSIMWKVCYHLEMESF